jgi:hypothetical protein
MSPTGRATVTGLQDWLDELRAAHGEWRGQVQLRAGSGHPCTLCRCKITERDSEHTVNLRSDGGDAEPAVLRFHASCYMTWDRFLSAITRRR